MGNKQYLSQAYPLTTKQRELMLKIGQSNYYVYYGELTNQKKTVLALIRKKLLYVDSLGMGILRFTPQGYKRWLQMKK